MDAEDQYIDLDYFDTFDDNDGHSPILVEGVGTYFGETNSSLQPHGIGQMKYLNGNVYIGEWVNGVLHGNGRMSYTSGIVYQGNWFENKRHGHGSYFNPNKPSGISYKGLWQNDKISRVNGDGRFFYQNHTIQINF